MWAFISAFKNSLESYMVSRKPKFLNIVDRFGENPEAMKQAGIAYATEQIIDLFATLDIKYFNIFSVTV